MHNKKLISSEVMLLVHLPINQKGTLNVPFLLSLIMINLAQNLSKLTVGLYRGIVSACNYTHLKPSSKTRPHLLRIGYTVGVIFRKVTSMNFFECRLEHSI